MRGISRTSKAWSADPDNPFADLVRELHPDPFTIGGRVARRLGATYGLAAAFV